MLTSRGDYAGLACGAGMPYTIGMNNAARTVATYSLNVVSIGYSVCCSVHRHTAQGSKLVTHVKARTGRDAVKEAVRMTRMVRHMGSLPRV